MSDYSKAHGLVRPHHMHVKIGDVLKSFDGLAESLERENKKIDLIVHSGDVNAGADEDGILAFEEILKKLDQVAKDCPVVAVPGNHDVRRGKFGGEDYYRTFSPSDGRPVYLPFSETNPPPKGKMVFLDPGRAVLVLPINSSRFSAGESELPTDSLVPVPGVGGRIASWLLHRKAFAPTLKQLRVSVDAARIGHDQFGYLSDLVKECEQDFIRHGRDLLKIAVLHHHLLPVSLDEEVKPYESLSDLAALRHFLREHDFKVVLHGHKHQFLTYRDFIPDITDMDAGYHQVSIISGPALGFAGNGDPAFLLIEVHTDSKAPTLHIQPWRLARLTATARPLEGKSRIERLFNAPSEKNLQAGKALLLNGCARTVHARALDLLTNFMPHDTSGDEIARRELLNMVCQVDREFTEEELSDLFQEEHVKLEGAELDQAAALSRFKEIVGWWQAKEYGPDFAGRFNHGSRIFSFGAEQLNQFEAAWKTLDQSPDTTRSLITLINPATDLEENSTVPFPSFCLLHFVLRRTNDIKYLDCVAYFRKQEMRQWWLVNLAEIDRLRRKVIQNLVHLKGLKLGRITTYTARAVASASALQVSIPELDRRVSSSEGQARISKHFVLLASKDADQREENIDEVIGFLEDLRPPDRFDPDGAPVSGPGVRYLHELSKSLAISDNQLDWATLADELRKMAEANEDYAKAMSSREAFEKWKLNINLHIEVVLGLLKRLRA